MLRKSLILATLAVALAACAATPPTTGPLRPISVSTVPYTVAVLDEVRVTYKDGHTETFKVEQDGMLALPGGNIRGAGVARGTLESRVRGAIPNASKVEVHEFQTNTVTVLGEVFHQIHTSLGDGPMRVLDAIAAANGFTPLADKQRVRLLRQNAGHIEIFELDLREMMKGGNLQQNVILQAGDVITVPRNFL